MNFLQQMVNQKLKTLTVDEVLHYSNMYGLKVTKEQAHQLIALLRKEQINAFDANEKKRLLSKISKNIDPDLAKQMNAILKKLTGI